jgi:hypothetical protein
VTASILSSGFEGDCSPFFVFLRGHSHRPSSRDVHDHGSHPILGVAQEGDGAVVLLMGLALQLDGSRRRAGKRSSDGK